MINLIAWFKARFPIQQHLPILTEKTVPIHKQSFWFYFGGISLFLFMVQVGTGLLLLLYYQPTPATAFESVQYITTQVRFGWLIRSVHSWSANLLIGAIFIHMFSVFFTQSYRRPRELTWFTGIGLLGIMMAFGFSGYLLPWNKLAFFATKVGTEIAGMTPIVGKFLLKFLRGGDEVSSATLARFFGMHVGLLPIAAMGLLGIHILLIQLHGMSKPIDEEKKGIPSKSLPFFPNFMLHDVLVWLIMFGVLAVLATLYPWELGEKADPFASAPAGIKPEWYFLFTFQTLKYVPAKILNFDGDMLAIIGFGLGGFLWMLVPFLDWKAARNEKSKLAIYIGIILICYMTIMTGIAYVAKP
jgi:cytochrome b6